MLIRYDSAFSKLSVDDGRGNSLTMTGTEADMLGDAFDFIASNPEEWKRARRESTLIIDQLSPTHTEKKGRRE